MNGFNGNGMNNGGLSIPRTTSPLFASPMALSLSKKNGPKKGPKAVKKATSTAAPKRFKSSFIFFSMAKHKEIKEELAKEDSNRKIPNITKLVSNAWRNITDEDRAKYDALAKEDKERYEREKATYVAPPGTSKKKLRDPTAPRRPMSAFLAFANSRRAQVKSEKPDCSNGEISKVLSRMWKEAEVEMKQKYRDEEAAHWVKYKAKMAEYRKKIDGMQKQAKAMQAAMEGMQSSMNDLKSNNEELLLNASDKVAKMSMSGLQEANSNLSGMLINANNLSTAPNREELIAASALYGVGGGANLLLGSGLQQAPVGNLGGYGALLGLNPNAGLAPFAGGLGGGVLGNATLMQDMSNPTNRALLELGLPLQQFAGYPLGNQQQALLAALGGAAAGYQMPLLGAGGVSDQQTTLSQLASLVGAHNALSRENIGQSSTLPSMNNSNEK